MCLSLWPLQKEETFSSQPNELNRQTATCSFIYNSNTDIQGNQKLSAACWLLVSKNNSAWTHERSNFSFEKFSLLFLWCPSAISIQAHKSERSPKTGGKNHVEQKALFVHLSHPSYIPHPDAPLAGAGRCSPAEWEQQHDSLSLHTVFSVQLIWERAEHQAHSQALCQAGAEG